MKPKISATVMRIALIALGMAEGFVNNIKDEYARSVLLSLFSNGKDLIKALADSNPEDKEQIQAIVNQFVSEVLPASEAELVQKIQLLENETVKTILLLMLPVASGIVRDLTDGEKPNGEQIKERLEVFVLDGDALPVIDALLSLFINNAGIRSLILVALIEALKTVIEDENETLNLSKKADGFKKSFASLSQ